MNTLRATCAPAALVFALAGPALADVTPDQVWERWTEYMTGFGYEVSATETRAGDTLVVSDIGIRFQVPEEEGSVEITYPGLDLVDNGDGTVSVLAPEQATMQIVTNLPDEEPVSLAIDTTHRALEIDVSGQPDALAYTYGAEEIAMVISAAQQADVPDNLGGSVVFSGFQGSTTTEIGEMREVDQTVSLDALRYDLRFADPESGGTGAFKGGYTALEFAGTMSLPEASDPSDMAEFLRAGLTFDGAFRHAGSSSEFAVVDAGQTTTGTITTESGKFTASMDPERISYDVSSRNLAVDLAGGQLPFPVSAGMAESGLRLSTPIVPTEEPRDISLALTLRDFTMSDVLWSVLDPMNTLPREPATVALDVSGTTRLLVNPMDPEAVAEAEQRDGPPAELHTLTLNALQIALAGAEVTGTGDFTFDNSDLATFNGFPRPTGGIDLEIAGINGLLDKLMQMGLVPPEQGMGARMMLGLFAVPVGDDQLRSRIEINEQGHVLANGQRLQ